MKKWVEIVGRVYGGDLSRPALASLAPSVLPCAEGGDGVAIAVIRSTAEGLTKKIVAVSQRLCVNREDGLSYCGALLMASPLLPSFVEEPLRSKRLNMSLPLVRLPAVLGTVVLTWERAGNILDESKLIKLESVAASL